MKKLTLNIFILVSALILTYCSDDKKEFKEENPLEAYLTTADFTEVYSFTNQPNQEFGLRFTPLVDGQIREVVVKLPDEQIDLRVTIWDAETKTVLRTEIIPEVLSDKETSITISRVSLKKNHEYMISFNTDNYYFHKRPDDESITYPVNAGNISITGYGYSTTTDQVYPEEFYDHFYAGDLSFVFRSVK